MPKKTDSNKPQPDAVPVQTDLALPQAIAPKQQKAVLEAESEEPNCILIQGFADLGHFLAWHQIQAPHEAVFPNAPPRQDVDDGHMIVIRGFDSLGHFLDWLDAKAGKTP